MSAMIDAEGWFDFSASRVRLYMPYSCRWRTKSKCRLARFVQKHRNFSIDKGYLEDVDFGSELERVISEPRQRKKE